MPWDSDLQNYNQIPGNSYTPGGYEKAKIIKLLLIVVGVILAIVLVIALAPESQQDKYTKNATAAARKQIPDAQVSSVKVAGGFAMATVSDPSAKGQANTGSTTIFKVNKDGSMVQIATGSSFSPLDLLGLGIPLATQAKLTGSDMASVKQNLAQLCGHSDDGAIGFTGFDGSFNPSGWQIDAATLGVLEQKLSDAITTQNASVKSDMSVICVKAIRQNSNFTTDKTTFISTFTLPVQFITDNGTLTAHTVTFAIGPNHYRNYTLDGQGM